MDTDYLNYIAKLEDIDPELASSIEEIRMLIPQEFLRSTIDEFIVYFESRDPSVLRTIIEEYEPTDPDRATRFAYMLPLEVLGVCIGEQWGLPQGLGRNVKKDL